LSNADSPGGAKKPPFRAYLGHRPRQSQRVGYAVVGLGHLAEHAILPAFRTSRKSRVVAVVSGDAQRAWDLAKPYGAADFSYAEYDACLAKREVEAVYIASVNSAHEEQVVRAAAARKHVLCEKPMATSVKECRRMIDACQANGVRLMIAYRKFFEPASLALKLLINKGELGRLKIIHSAFTLNLPATKAAAWHLNKRAAGGGSLVDVGVYCVNTARWLLGTEPQEASAYAWSVDPKRFSEVEENMAFRLTFPEGVVLEASCSFGAAQSSFLHIHGERGWVALDPAYAYDYERRLFGEIDGKRFQRYFPRMGEFSLELDAFADCVRRDRQPEPSGWQGLRDVAVMEAIYRAAQEKRTVPVEQ
jgi:predicted dehydrogenase